MVNIISWRWRLPLGFLGLWHLYRSVTLLHATRSFWIHTWKVLGGGVDSWGRTPAGPSDPIGRSQKRTKKKWRKWNFNSTSDLADADRTNERREAERNGSKLGFASFPQQFFSSVCCTFQIFFRREHIPLTFSTNTFFCVFIIREKCFPEKHISHKSILLSAIQGKEDRINQI